MADDDDDDDDLGPEASQTTAHKVPLRCDHAKANLRIAKSCVRLHLESASRIVNTLTVHFLTPKFE